MKRILMAASIVAGLLALPLVAEESHHLKVEIPFAFHAGEVWLPPGDYTVTQFQPSVIAIHSKDALDHALILAHRSSFQKAEPKAYLVFNRYPGERYFLAQVWQPDENQGLQLVKTRKERELVTSTLHSEARPAQVVILARVVR